MAYWYTGSAFFQIPQSYLKPCSPKQLSIPWVIKLGGYFQKKWCGVYLNLITIWIVDNDFKPLLTISCEPHCNLGNVILGMVYIVQADKANIHLCTYVVDVAICHLPWLYLYRCCKQFSFFSNLGKKILNSIVAVLLFSNYGKNSNINCTPLWLSTYLWKYSQYLYLTHSHRPKQLVLSPYCSLFPFLFQEDDFQYKHIVF